MEDQYEPAEPEVAAAIWARFQYVEGLWWREDWFKAIKRAKEAANTRKEREAEEHKQAELAEIRRRGYDPELCRHYNIPVAGVGIYGTCPVVRIDTHPFLSGGTHGKYCTIIQHSEHFVADFDITQLGVPANYIGMGDWIIDWDRLFK